MRDDWRLRMQFDEEASARDMVDRLEAFELPHGIKQAFRDRVIVSRDGPVVFCYTDSREQARRPRAQSSSSRPGTAGGMSSRSNAGIRPPSGGRTHRYRFPTRPKSCREEHAELIEGEREESPLRAIRSTRSG